MPGKQDSPGAEDAAPTLPSVRPPCDRLPCNKSSVCSRSYFVVVMVFFHIYIINVIALLLYVHYSSGQDEASSRGRGHQRPASGSESPKPDVSLTRIEGIRVSNLTWWDCSWSWFQFSHLISLAHSCTVGWTCPQGVPGAWKSAWNAHSESETSALWYKQTIYPSASSQP